MPYQNQWIREGFAKGRNKGRVEGVAENIKAFIKARFQTIPQSVEHKIANESNPSVLAAWSKQLFDGKGLDDVFGKST